MRHSVFAIYSLPTSGGERFASSQMVNGDLAARTQRFDEFDGVEELSLRRRPTPPPPSLGQGSVGVDPQSCKGQQARALLSKHGFGVVMTRRRGLFA